MEINDQNYSAKEYFQEIVQNSLDIFHELTRWSEQEFEEFSILLKRLKGTTCCAPTESTKAKGDRLEDLVEFIIKKTYFFEIFRNISTASNEIDEIIVLSDAGKQALQSFGIARDVLGIDTDIALGECKNYRTTLGVTYVGKFYSLLVSTGVLFGILFTVNGLTGSEDGFSDGYGLTKVLHIIEQHQNGRDLKILVFTLDDYEKMAKGANFYDLIKAKKVALQTATTYDAFLKEQPHENTENIIQLLREVK